MTIRWTKWTFQNLTCCLHAFYTTYWLHQCPVDIDNVVHQPHVLFLFFCVCFWVHWKTVLNFQVGWNSFSNLTPVWTVWNAPGIRAKRRAPGLRLRYICGKLFREVWSSDEINGFPMPRGVWVFGWFFGSFLVLVETRRAETFSWLVFFIFWWLHFSDVRYVRFNPHAHGEANSTFLEIPCYPRGVSSFFCSKFLPKFNLISVKKYPPKNHLKMDGKGRRPFPFWGKRPIFRGELAVSFRGGSILNQFPTSMCELTSNHGTAIQLCHACFVDLLDLQVVVEKNTQNKRMTVEHHLIFNRWCTPWKNSDGPPKKWRSGRCFSFELGEFLGCMLIFRGVHLQHSHVSFGGCRFYGILTTTNSTFVTYSIFFSEKQWEL